MDIQLRYLRTYNSFFSTIQVLQVLWSIVHGLAYYATQVLRVLQDYENCGVEVRVLWSELSLQESSRYSKKGYKVTVKYKKLSYKIRLRILFWFMITSLYLITQSKSLRFFEMSDFTPSEGNFLLFFALWLKGRHMGLEH